MSKESFLRRCARSLGEVLVGISLMALVGSIIVWAATPDEQPNTSSEPKKLIIVDWCVPIVDYATYVVIRRRTGATYGQMRNSVEVGSEAHREKTKEQLFSIIDRAYEIPEEDLRSVDSLWQYLQDISNECTNWLEEANEEAEKGMAI